MTLPLLYLLLIGTSFQCHTPAILTAILTMNIFTIKENKHRENIEAKSIVVAQGNLDKRKWEKHDTYAPVLSPIGTRRLLTSLAASQGRVLKQGD